MSEPPPTVPAAEARAIAELIAFVEARVPEPYRAVVLAHLLRSGRGLGSSEPPTPDRASDHRGSPTPVAIDLEGFAPRLFRRGEPLVKALIVLHVSREQLGARWLTPAEISNFLRDRAGVTSAYRSNISNALRREAVLVERRRRGRGFEYGLTARGREFAVGLVAGR